MIQGNSTLLIHSNMSDYSFQDFCQNNICSNCSAGSDYCFPPLSDECPEAEEFLPLYNAMWLASLAENAMFDYDEDDPAGIALCKCWEEQDNLCEQLTNHLSGLMERHSY